MKPISHTCTIQWLLIQQACNRRPIYSSWNILFLVVKCRATAPTYTTMVIMGFWKPSFLSTTCTITNVDCHEHSKSCAHEGKGKKTGFHSLAKQIPSSLFKAAKEMWNRHAVYGAFITVCGGVWWFWLNHPRHMLKSGLKRALSNEMLRCVWGSTLIYVLT